jgi:hypothetical protein
LAWHNGKRQDRDFLELQKMLGCLPVKCYHTNNGVYIPDIYRKKCTVLEKTGHGRQNVKTLISEHI